MSRITKWKLEKTKVKVVFRLQFHATHIPQTGWEKLFISFIPNESGKTTAKTTKANVRNGTCKWADPIYETTRLLQDSLSRQCDEKLYKLVVAMGSSRSSILGEATINLSDYADALKPSAVDLPLLGCNSGTILHVTVQLLTSKTGFREFEQQRELRERGLQMGTDLNRHDVSGTGKVSSPEEIANDEMDKVNTRRFRPKSKEIPSLEEVGLNEEYTDSAVGFDGSSSTSGSLYTEKHDTSSAHEIDSLKSTVSGDLNGLLHCQSFQTEKGDPSNHRNLAQGSSDWVQGWGSDYSMDNDLANAYEENSRLRGSLEVAESSIFELKLEVSSLQSHADELGVETQKLAHQLAAEIASGEKLEKEVLVMKLECSKFKDDLEGLKNLKLSSQSTDASDAMDGKNFELLRQLEEAKVERESLARKMDQMECYYEALIQELEENQKQMLGELQNLRDEHSKCLCTISTNKAEIESVRQDMTEQITRFSEERRDLDSLTKELERRAMNSEAALKRARLNYSIAVDQLQKDVELLSFQVLSMYETNENLIKQTFSETLQPCFKGYPYIVQNQVGVKDQLLGGDVLLDDLKKSFCLQEDLNQKVEGELCEMNSTNLYLDVFSKILQETLLEANIDIRLMKEKMDEFARQFEISTVSRDLLMVKLQTAMDDIHTLNEFKASCIAKCSDILLQNQILEAQLESVSKEKCLLTQKITEYEALMMEYRGYESKYEACSAEKLELENLLKLETLKKGDLQNEMSSLKEELKTFKDGFNDMAISKENLQRIINFLKEKLCSLLASYDEQFSGLSLLSNFQYQSGEFEDFKGIIMQLEEIQHNACKKTLQLMEEKNDLEYDRDATEVSLSTARSEILRMKQKFKHDIQDIVAKLDVSNALVEKLQLELESVSYKFQISSEVEEKYAQQNKEVFADLALFDLELQKLTSKNRDLAQEILGLDTMAEELGKSKLSIAELIQEKQDLRMSLQGKNGESAKLIYEHDSLKESLRCLHDELHVERGFREKLEGTVTDLTSQLNEEHGKCLEKLQKDYSCLTDLKSQLSDMHEYLISAEVKLTFVRTQYKTWIEMLVQELQSSDGHHNELQKKHLAMEEILNRCLASEAHYIEENGKLVTTLDSLRFELETSVSQNRVFSDSNNFMTAQLEECKKRLETLEVSFSDDNNRHALQEEQLKHMLENAEEEIGNLIFSKEELEIIVIVLKAKLEEQYSHLTILEDYSDESMMLRNQCNELTHNLSEQILKTEEFKNLSIHLKELKDKADAECLLARERREPEGPSFAMQESLRIAFLKEQYETKLQELRQQLSISRKHGEEMLWKLQDVVDEIENRKKSEASHLKLNEELSFKILELEAELQSVLSDKREKIKAYDRIKAELDCALLSLECCKEERENLESSLHECMEEKSKIAVELTLRKGQVESSTSPLSIQKEENGGGPESLDQNSLKCSEELQDASSLPIGQGEQHSTELMNAKSIQGVLLSKSLHGIPEHAFLGQGDLPLGNSKNLTIINDHFRAQSLKSSMEHLHEELGRMKNENSLLHQTNFDPKFQDLQRELMQLHKANQELGSVFPSFNESSGSGNALERVLALEIDLAETLRAKKKSSIHFQSSFLKQHGDEEAVFRIFRDINELIKDMLERKGRYADVETDLKEMHDRYSQLSLQFAEVEGERQKLMMTLKNVRTSKKLSHSSSATLDDPS